MKQGLPLLFAHLSIGITQHESNGSKEVTLPGAISSHDDIMLGRKGLDDGLFLVAGKMLDADLPRSLIPAF